MVSGGMACIKYLVFIVNVLFAIIGIVFIAVGTVILVLYSDYNNFMDSWFFTTPVLMIIVGAIVFVVSFLGCCGAIKESHCMLITFSIFLLLIFALQFGSALVAYVMRVEVRKMLENRLNSTMEEYSTKSDIRRSWDIMQHDLQCCGMMGPTDWADVGFAENTVPISCCREVLQGSNCDANSVHIYSSGCMNNLQAVIDHNALILGSVGTGISVIELIGIIFACCLARSIRREYETV